MSQRHLLLGKKMEGKKIKDRFFETSRSKRL